jgi:hypothetical protein
MGQVQIALAAGMTAGLCDPKYLSGSAKNLAWHPALQK